MLCHGTDKDTNSYTYYIFFTFKLVSLKLIYSFGSINPTFLFYFILFLATFM